MMILLWVVAVVLALYALLLVLMYVYQEKLIFPGTPLPVNYSFTFDQPFTEYSIAVEGAMLNALHFHSDGPPNGFVFFLHGNAGNLAVWTENIHRYRDMNIDVFLLDYRGYGKSTGKITDIEQLHNDIRAAWDFIIPRYRDKNIPITIYGRSLGSGLATQLATAVEHHQLILVSPFSSIKAMLKQHYPYVPSLLLRYPLITEDIIDQVRSAVYFIVGDQDNYTPLSQARRLQEKIGSPSNMYMVNGADHGNIHEFEQYWACYRALLLGETSNNDAI